MTPITSGDVVTFLTIIILIMLVVFLYHVIVVMLSARRIMRRADRVSDEIEEVVMKPLTAADNVMEWIIGFINGLQETRKRKKHHRGKTEEFEVADL